MVEEVLSPRYCALMDGPCTETFPSDAETAAFVAYPNVDPIAHDMREAARESSRRGMHVRTWEDLPREGRIVFCDLCKAIVAAKQLWAEITVANQNVFFEMGYAVAKGRGLRLLRDPSVTGDQVDLVSTLRYIEYENVAELLNKVAEPPEDRPLAAQCRDRAQTYAEGLHVLFLRTEFRTTAAERIYKELSRRLAPLKIRVRVDDPSELPGHDLLELTTLASRGLFVVANLVHRNRQDSHLHNAAASFIAGYAMGAERRLLVLQEQPADRMLDLKQVSKEYRTATDAARHLGQWLEHIMPEVRAVAEDVQSRRQVAQAQLQRWAIDLGAVAAEYDRLLTECFVESSAYQAALTGQRDLFVGRRGTGKTANCLLLAAAIDSRSRAIVTVIAPEKLQLRDMTEKVAASLQRQPDAAVFEAMWRFVLCTEIAAGVVRHYDQHSHLDDHGARQQIAELFERMECELATSFDERLFQAMARLPELPPDDTNAREVMLQEFYTQDIAELVNLLRALPAAPEVFLLIDNLDRDWTPEYAGLTVGLVNGLLNEAQRLSHKDLRDLARVVVFLRSDIYEVASSKDPDADKKAPIYLRWDGESLLRLVTARIAAAIREAGEVPPTEPADVWALAFEPTMSDGQRTFDYLVERTMLRPRDILQFCTRCLEEARHSAHNRVTPQDILVAERRFSEDLFHHVKQEYAVGHPSLESIGAELLASPSAMSERRFKEKLQQATTRDPQLAHYSLDDLFRFCYDTGVIGLKVSDETYYSFNGGPSEDPIARALQLAQARKVPLQVLVHKGLRDHLQTRESVGG